MSAANVTPLRPENELAYRRWVPGEFSAPQATPAKPEPAPEPAGEEVPAFALPTAESLERIHNEAHEAGHKAGYAEGYEEGTARVRMEALQLNTLLENLDAAIGGFDQQVGESLLSLAIELARQVLRRELATQPESLIDVVREALAQMPHQHIAVVVNPDDAQLIRTHLVDQVIHAGHRIREDVSITRGGCRLEAAGTQLDATVETRWRRVVETLGERDEWQTERRTEGN